MYFIYEDDFFVMETEQIDFALLPLTWNAFHFPNKPKTHLITSRVYPKSLSHSTFFPGFLQHNRAESLAIGIIAIDG